MNSLSNFQVYAQSLVDTHNVPAVSLAVWHKNQLHQAAAGVLNVNTGVEATTDSIFQIGSITKVMTASLIMQLVDEEKVELDKSVKHYLRDFAIADAEATQIITVRHLLNHTNGIAGDFFPDDNCQSGDHIARYVDRCCLLPLVHPVGEYCAYSNAAFVIAGRLIEVVTGASWFDAMEERIFEPLGMTHSICRPMNTLRFRAAIGHIPDADSALGWQLPEKSYIPLGAAPAGATPTMTAADLITFARAHLNKGVIRGGVQWMSEEAIAQMQLPQIETPSMSASPAITGYMGLGWQLQKINKSNRFTFSHAGGTFGQQSMLKIVPDQGLCIAVLVNGQTEGVVQSITAELLEELADIDLTEPEPSFVIMPEQQLLNYIGSYQSPGEHYSFSVEDGELMALYKDIVLNEPAKQLRLKALDSSLWVGYDEDNIAVTKLRFLNPDEQGVSPYLFNGRMLQRVN